MELPLSRSGRGALEIVTHAAREAGKTLRSHFYADKQVELKGRGNIVTDVDLLVDRDIITILRDEYPDSGILSEESEEIEGDSGYTWVIDPLDGTNNYAFGIPFFSVNIALVQGEEILLGITYDPLRDEVFQAEGRRGAFLNGSPISISTKTRVRDSFIGYDMGYDDEEGREILRVARRLWPNIYGLRVMGSAALGLAYAACGRVDLYFHRFLYPWDIASGILLVREAGGRVVGWGGEDATIKNKGLIASNEAIIGDFLGRVGEE